MRDQRTSAPRPSSSDEPPETTSGELHACDECGTPHPRARRGWKARYCSLTCATARRPTRQPRDTLSPEERTLRARLAAHAMHAKHDARRTTVKARGAFLTRFEREVDPEGVLNPEERARRAEHALRAHMTRLRLADAKARRIKRDKATASTTRPIERAAPSISAPTGEES